MLPEIVPRSKAKVFAKQLVDSIDILTPQQLGIPVEGDEGHIYVSEVLNWWVNKLF